MEGWGGCLDNWGKGCALGLVLGEFFGFRVSFFFSFELCLHGYLLWL